MAKFTLSLNGPSSKISDKLTKESFDYTSRHQIIAEIIKQYFDKTPKNILDVGGLGSPLSSILGVQTTILDEEAEDKKGKSEKKGDGSRMAFEDNSFEAVVTSDTLEHIPEKDRRNFISELMRVSSDLVILCAPFNHGDVAKEEQKLQDYFVKLTGSEHRWLKEHKDYGLPQPAKIDKYFTDSGASIIRFNHTSLKWWRTLMSINLVSNEMGQIDIHRKTQELNAFYNKNILFKDFGDDSYRTFFVASKKKDLAFGKHPGVDQQVGIELLGLINDFYQNALVEAEYIPPLRKKIKDMHDEKIELANMVDAERRRYNDLRGSVGGRTLSAINSIKRGGRKRG